MTRVSSFLVVAVALMAFVMTVQAHLPQQQPQPAPGAPGSAEAVLANSNGEGLFNHFEPSHVRLIDRTNASTGLNNFLFRGNEPSFTNETFAWRDVVNALNAVAKQNNVTLPSNFYFVDINLLNYITEWADIDMEKNFFVANPTLGSFVHWPIFGDLIGPDDVPKDAIREMALTLDDWQVPDQLPVKMKLLREMLLTKGPGGRPLVYYIHCEAGTDRTGELSGAYYMKYLNWTYQQALAYDHTIENRNISIFSQNGLQWYCYYLYYAEKRTTLNCTNPPSPSPSPKAVAP